MDRWILLATTLIAVATAVAGILQKRKQPILDEAQAESTLVNSDSVKQQIKKMSDESNLRRDKRILELEDWAFQKVRPWGRDVVQKFDIIADLLRNELWEQGQQMPEIHLAPFPEMPEPPSISI